MTGKSFVFEGGLLPNDATALTMHAASTLKSRMPRILDSSSWFFKGAALASATDDFDKDEDEEDEDEEEEEEEDEKDEDEEEEGEDNFFMR